MQRLNTKRDIAVLAFSGLLAAASILWFFADSTPPTVSSEADSATPHPAGNVADTSKEVLRHRAKALESADESSLEAEALQRFAEESEKSLKDWERSRSRIAATMQFEGAIRVIATIPQPTEAECAQIALSMSKRCESLPANAKRAGVKLEAELLKEYTDYPAPVKIVDVLRGQRSNNPLQVPPGTEYVTERFVASKESMVLSDSGRMTFNDLIASRRVFTQRYDHLFQASDFQ